MVKVYRLTLGFDPISSVDVEAKDIIDAMNKTVEWLKKSGNEIDESIVLSCELVSETNPLEVAPQEDDESTE